MKTTEIKLCGFYSALAVTLSEIKAIENSTFLNYSTDIQIRLGILKSMASDLRNSISILTASDP